MVITPHSLYSGIGVYLAFYSKISLTVSSSYDGERDRWAEVLPPVVLVVQTLEVKLPLLYFLLLNRVVELAVVDVVVGVEDWKGDLVDAFKRVPCVPGTLIDCWGVLRATKLFPHCCWFVFDVWLDEWSCDTLLDVWDVGWKYVCIEGVP